METSEAVKTLAALAQSARLAIFRALVAAGPPGLAAGRLAECLDCAPSSLSFHLKELAHAGLVRSQAQGRFVIYSADFDAMNALVAFLTDHCCNGNPALCRPARAADGSPLTPLATTPLATPCAGAAMTNQAIYNLLVLCTGNSARSIMAEALFNQLGQGRVRAYSAGSHPTGQVHPLALEQVQAHGGDTAALRSKSWDEFAAPGAPRMDWVITVCDNAAGQACPLWPGQPISAHWGFEDPAAVQGGPEAQRRAFSDVFGQIQRRVQRMLSLPIETLDAQGLARELKAIGQGA